jgi:Insertion element 4 transposase N-terminal/Transposase DDE domain
MVDAVVREAGAREQRSRLLPSRLVVYYVLALTLFSQAGYEEVMRSLVEGLAWESGWAQRWTVPSQPAISQARARLGDKPLAGLFARGCVPLATPATPGGFWRGRRLVSMDGSTLDVADTPANAEEFGRPGSGRGSGQGAFPQLRVVGLAECATHAMFAAAMGSCTTGEVTLAAQLVEALRPGMLVLADRGFTAHPLFSAFAASGADLCWRAKGNAVLPVLERHRDGSFRSELVAADDKYARAKVTPVRVVEYALDDPGRPQAEDNRYRLVTTILDADNAPAVELAALYAERWEFESALDELKSHQRGPRVVLRSKSPEGVRQEAWGFLCTHYAIRALMATAAGDDGVDPDRVSFTRALHAARRSVRAGLGTTSTALSVALPVVVAEINDEPLRPRRLRAAGRVVKRKMSNYAVKRAEHRSWPQPTRSPADAVRILRPEASPA